MEVEFPSSPDMSFEIPSIIEAISSSIDDSRFNFEELEKSSEDASTATESDQMDFEDNWHMGVPNNNQNYYQNYQHQQTMQWNYQQGFSHYPQYGYMTPSPYNSYYMQSSPVDYHQNYAYNNYEQQQQQPYVFTATPNSSQQESQNSCTICSRSFKSASNLTRHFMSKTHLKRLESKKQNSKVTVIRVKKTKVNSVGSPFTDLSKDEKEFLWQLDDEIAKFLKEYEEEKRLKVSNDGKKDLIPPTPPLSPNSRGLEAKNGNIVGHGYKTVNLSKSESIVSVSSSSERSQSSPESVRSQSVESATVVNVKSNATNLYANSQFNAHQSTYSVSPSPVMVKLENGENVEVIFSDENFGGNL